MASPAGRERWSSHAGFVLAAIGSAVGLGNMWRFSYLAAENGGAAFVIFYVGLTITVGIPVLLAELAIGRGAQQSPVRALVHFGGGAWKPLGMVFVAAGFLILSYYGVIAGWTVRYAWISLVGGFGENAADRFADISEGWDALAFHVAFMLATIAIVGSGVKSGIERASIVMMPALFAIVAGLAIWAATLDGAGPGYAAYLNADFSKLWDRNVIKDAAGQAFFSLSLGMGAMLTYASYLGRDENLPSESVMIAGADVAIAFVAGLVVFPLIFALGLSDAVSASTVGALFITLPQAFAHMGVVGQVVGVLFFVALIVGALTSAMSLLEVVVASTMDGLGWSRHKAAWITGAAITGLGAFSAFDLRVLDVADQFANNILLLGGGFALCVFVGWVMPDPIGEVRAGAEGVTWFPIWRALLRFVVPLFLGFVLLSAVPATFDALRGLFAG
jgi:neurotransmitter:Na+ symporter, NSS family